MQRYRICEYRNGTTELVWQSPYLLDSYDEAYRRAERMARGRYTTEFAVEPVTDETASTETTPRS